MKYLLLILFIFMELAMADSSNKMYECTKIFENRKNELLVELERIDEQKQALDALKIATEDLLKKKQNDITARESVVNTKSKDVDAKMATVKSMLEENKKLLAEIKSIKMDKITQTYAKMKPDAASNVLSAMDETGAVKILTGLKPNVVGKILSKMEPKKASKITTMLTQVKGE